MLTQAVENFADNMLPLGFKLYDLYQLSNNQMDKCLTDLEYIQEAGYIVEDLSNMLSIIMGLDLEWDKAEIYQGEAYGFDSDINTISRDPMTIHQFLQKYVY